MYTKEERRGGTNWEIGIDIYTIMCKRQLVGSCSIEQWVQLCALC